MRIGLVMGVAVMLVFGGVGGSCARDAVSQQAATGEPVANTLHNVHRVNDRFISGAAPDGDAGFDELKAMGVRTVISVDGGAPDVARAEARGMRYVHIPVTYANVTEAQRLEIARAVRDLPGPVYLHCHHGKHRGPAAAASAAVALGWMTGEEGVAFMKTAGTAPNYAGLYGCVAAAMVAAPGSIDAAPAEFPSVRRVEGLVAAMVEIDAANELLREIRAAGWRTPDDHPDLVPAAEAGRLADGLRVSMEDPRARGKGEEFVERMREAARRASELEEGIVAGKGREELEGMFKGVQASCTGCHVKYRDGE